MLFDFQEFVDELRNNEEKKQIVEKYEKLYGPINWDIKDQEWYKEYLSKFQNLEYKIPAELKNDFDWEILLQLVVGSFSSDYEIKKNESEADRELYIAVKSWDQSVVKTVSELWSFQISRLYEIYIEEQINLHSLKKEDENEKNAIEQERGMRIQRRQAILSTINKDQEAKDAKADQENKLDDLMGQL